MKYMLLIYEPEAAAPKPGSPEFSAIMNGYRAFTQEVQERGVLVGGNPLEPVSTAKSVRIRNGSAEMADGPFAETKEHLAGYYMLECASREEALQYAAKIPSAAYGTVEVRPVRTIAPPE